MADLSADANTQVTLLYQKVLAQIDTVTLDASIRETHSTRVKITDHPVEQGVDISDHLRQEPDRVTIEGVVTNTPLGNTQPAFVSVAGNQNTPPFSFLRTSIYVMNLAENAYYALLDLAGADNLITVVTALRVYENMAMESLDVPRDAKIGQSVKFTATFKEVQIVLNQTVTVARAETQQGNKNLGKVAAQPVEKSWAASGADLLKKGTGFTLGGLAQ